MTPKEVLARVLEAGGQIVPDPERPRLLVPPDLKPLVVQHRVALRQLLRYRATLRRWWALMAQGPTANLAQARRAYQDLIRLMDEVGEPQATQLRRQWAREWWQETGVCPFCGERGPYHDPEPERGGETA